MKEEEITLATDLNQLDYIHFVFYLTSYADEYQDSPPKLLALAGLILFLLVLSMAVVWLYAGQNSKAMNSFFQP